MSPFLDQKDQMNEQQGVAAAGNLPCLRLVTLAAVTHSSLMFSHQGSAERDARGKWGQLAGCKMKRDTVFYDLTGAFLSLADSHLAVGGI